MSTPIKNSLLSALLLLGLSAAVGAQNPRREPGPPPPGGPRGERRPGPPGGGPGGPGDWDRRPGPDFRFQSFEIFSDNKVVKGAPYSATAITETVQTLSDGSKLTRKKTDTLYRDGEGRTRREQQFDRVGPFPVEGEPQQVVFVNDVVTGHRYFLDPGKRVARKTPIANRPPMPFGPRPGPGPGGNDRRTESLGKQIIEGIEAEGTRTTFTIPAGRIGNDRPLETISERWESTELQLVLLSKHSDPFAGVTVYRLTNLKREEPPRALFELPSDYTLEEDRPGRGPWEQRRKRPNE
ncbi:MAG: hypothetical protein SF339_12570 [Blastocatellia bacterium]|nr:hypothetical protein [Blastocatellia bacterium]